MYKKLIYIVLLGVVCWFVKPNIFCQAVSTITEQQQIDPFQQAVDDSKSTDPYTRRRAAEQFGMLRDVRAVPYLIKLSKDENPFVRQAAVDALGLLRTKDSVDVIIDVLKTDKEQQVRQSAIVALGYIGDTKPVSLLTQILQDEKEPVAIKYAVCNTLSILGSTEPVPVLIKLLDSEDINLRRSAIYALAKIPHNDCIVALRDTLKKEYQNEQLAVDLVRILTDKNDVDSIETFKMIYSTPTVTQKVRFYAACGIAKIKKDTSVLPVIKKSLKSTDESIKNAAIDAIRLVGDKESLIMLKEMQKTETSPYTRQLIDIAIKQLETKYPPVKQPVQQKKK